MPPTEGPLVVGEIESHTGLIVQSGPDRFEFSHLALMEYLAAEDLLKRPGELTKCWQALPEIAAVAVSMSRDGGEWIETFLAGLPANVENVVPLVRFMTRFASERPRVYSSAEVGRALLTFIFKTADRISPVIAASLSTIPGVQQSIGEFSRSVRLGRQGNKTTFNWGGGYVDRTFAISIRSDVLAALCGGAPPQNVLLSGDPKLQMLEF